MRGHGSRRLGTRQAGVREIDRSTGIRGRLRRKGSASRRREGEAKKGKYQVAKLVEWGISSLGWHTPLTRWRTQICKKSGKGRAQKRFLFRCPKQALILRTENRQGDKQSDFWSKKQQLFSLVTEQKMPALVVSHAILI